MEEIIRNLALEKASKTDKVIKALKRIGINLENCFFDGKDNLIIPMSEMQK